MDCLAELAGGMTMLDAKKNNMTLKQWINGFIDDKSLFTNIDRNGQNCNNIKRLTQALKTDLQAWKELLEALRGKLELPKCFYYVKS
jgi:FtsZ-binding cell division protein ZapB